MIVTVGQTDLVQYTYIRDVVKHYKDLSTSELYCIRGGWARHHWATRSFVTHKISIHRLNPDELITVDTCSIQSCGSRCQPTATLENSKLWNSISKVLETIHQEHLGKHKHHPNDLEEDIMSDIALILIGRPTYKGWQFKLWSTCYESILEAIRTYIRM